MEYYNYEPAMAFVGDNTKGMTGFGVDEPLKGLRH
jgi:hypothetical protein